MKDYNFFEIYEKKRTLFINPRSIYFIGSMALLLSIFISLSFLGRNIYISYQTDKMINESNVIKATKEYIEADRLQNSVNAMNEYDVNAEIALNKFNDYNLLGSKILSSLSSTLPIGVSINSLSMNNASANLAFNALDRKSVAELLVNLNDSMLFKEIHFSSVTANVSGAGYIANIQCIMETGDQNE